MAKLNEVQQVGVGRIGHGLEDLMEDFNERMDKIDAMLADMVKMLEEMK